MPASDPPKFLRWLGGQLPGNQSFWVPGEVWLQSWNLKELTEGHHQEWSLRLNLTQHGKPHQAQTLEGLTDWELFLDSVGGGAWPFLVGGAICLVNSDNERDSSLLNRRYTFQYLEGSHLSFLYCTSLDISVFSVGVWWVGVCGFYYWRTYKSS